MYDEEQIESPESQVFLPLPDPNHIDFRETAARQIHGIVHARQMHSRHHTATCFKYNSKECRLRFPREIIPSSYMDMETQVIRVKRDDRWLNGYNP